MSSIDFASGDLSALDFGSAAELAIADRSADLPFREARTPYAFTDEEVSDDQVRRVYDLIKWGPTSMNGQPLRVVLIRSAEARARLVPLMGGNNQGRTASAPLVAVLAADTDWHEELPRVYPGYAGARTALAANEEGRVRSARESAAIQAGYFIVGVRAAGLSVGPMGGFDTDAVSREFFPDGAHRAFLVVSIGYADASGYRPRNPRLDYDEVFSTV